MQIDDYWLRLRADRRAENRSKAMRIVRYGAVATVWLLLTSLAHAAEPMDYAGT